MHGCIFSVITSGVICVKVVLCSPSHSDDHVGTHAHATAPYTFDNCTRSGSSGGSRGGGARGAGAPPLAREKFFFI